VDDDEALRRLMRLELSDAYEVIDSGEPEQGLALALEHRRIRVCLRKLILLVVFGKILFRLR
jgi:hypothetical protein